ncbi:MAG: hypothetical protein IT186_21655 [Acidobacteria bacterium]|nr:hypothetical protein [Acidobacteriota bacterium]
MADSATLQPVPGAWVNTTPSGTAVQTHSNGGFLVYRQAGTYTVTVSKTGYVWFASASTPVAAPCGRREPSRAPCCCQEAQWPISRPSRPSCLTE